MELPLVNALVTTQTEVPGEALHADGLRLLADVGGTNARFALESALDRYWAVDVLPCEAHETLESAVRAFLDAHGNPPVRHAAFSVAVPVSGDHIKLTNHPWAFSVEALRRSLKLQTLLVVNDYTALAMGLTRLEAEDVAQVGGGEPVAAAVLGVIGPGTGLGVSGLVPFQDRNVALATEGGHVSYPPQDEDEERVVALARQRHGHASAERLISGPGLELIYEALALHAGQEPVQRRAPDISRAATDAALVDPLARRALEVFCAMLGTVAGNLALTLGCQGGLYIGGGIVPQVLEFFQRSSFRRRFESKGRFSQYLRGIPTYVITAPRPALRGVSAILEDHLSAEHGAGRLLEDIRAALERLSAAERQVARDVLTAPRAWLTDPIVQIAGRCGVSTPTVMRFCRSMGFKGLSDFKLRLGAGLSGKSQHSHQEVQATAPVAERMATIFNNSISALVALRDRLSPEVFERTVTEMAAARRIEIYGLGTAAVAAEDAMHKLARIGLMAVARTDAVQQSVTSVFLNSEDVLLVLSNSGELEPMNESVARARRAGTRIIVACPQRSELARLSDILLPVDHPGDVRALVPMVSRLMQTMIIDVLVTELALKRRDLISRSLASQDDQRFGVLSSHLR